MAGIIDRSENGGRTVGPDLEVKPPRLPLGCVGCVLRPHLVIINSPVKWLVCQAGPAHHRLRA